MAYGGALAPEGQLRTQARRIRVPEEHSLRDVIGIIVEGKVVPALLTIPEGLTSEQIVSRLTTTRFSPAACAKCRAKAHCCRRPTSFPGYLARAGDPAHATDAEARAGEIWERRNPDVPVKSPEQLVTLLPSSRRKPQGRRAQPCRRRLHQPVCGRRSSCNPTRPSSMASSAAGVRWGADQALGDHPAFAVQHLCDRWPTAGPIANPGRASLKPPPTRRARATCSSWPMHRRTRLYGTYDGIRRTSQNCAR